MANETLPDLSEQVSADLIAAGTDIKVKLRNKEKLTQDEIENAIRIVLEGVEKWKR